MNGGVLRQGNVWKSFPKPYKERTRSRLIKFSRLRGAVCEGFAPKVHSIMSLVTELQQVKLLSRAFPHTPT